MARKMLAETEESDEVVRETEKPGNRDWLTFGASLSFGLRSKLVNPGDLRPVDSTGLAWEELAVLDAGAFSAKRSRGFECR